MFDFGLSFSHIVVIAVLATLVIGPKDLPVVLRRFGQFIAKMRRMAGEFRGQMDSAMKDAGLDGVKKDLASVASGVSAIMSPVQSALAATATSLPALASSTSAPTVAPGTTMTPALPQLERPSAYFAEGQGETRVLGRNVLEPAP